MTPQDHKAAEEFANNPKERCCCSDDLESGFLAGIEHERKRARGLVEAAKDILKKRSALIFADQDDHIESYFDPLTQALKAYEGGGE